MISCTEFIAAYSELFKFLEKKGGKQAVYDFWNYLSDQFLGNLRDQVKQKGIRGCWDYWSHTLNEESADFTMELDEDAQELRSIMYHCPSKGRLLEYKHIEPYRDYCEHCTVLYRRVLKPLGFDHVMDLSESHQAKCSDVIKRKN